MTVAELTSVDRQALVNALATREGSATDIAKWYALTPTELTEFVAENRAELEDTRTRLLSTAVVPSESDATPTPTQLADLWLTNKFERLKRYQDVAELLYTDLAAGGLSGADLSTAAREFRSYCSLAANELGHLLHRGAGDSGDGDTLSIDLNGVDINSLK
jgi:hypothetical protein